MKTKKLRWVVYAILATILLIPNLVEGAEKVQCRLKFEKNKSYYIRITTDTQVTMEVTRQGTGKQEVLEHSVFAFGYEVDVDEIDAEGNAWIKVLYDQVSFSQKTPQTEVRYDSSKKYHKIALSAKGFAALVGQRFYLKITPQGRIEKINGLPAMRSYVKINLPGRVTEAQRTLMLEGMKEQLDEEAVKESFETFMAIYPDRVVDVNDSWEETIILSQSPAMVLEKTSKLKTRRNGIAFIDNAGFLFNGSKFTIFILDHQAPRQSQSGNLVKWQTDVVF